MIKKNPLICSQTFTINEDINLNAQLFVLIKDLRVISNLQTESGNPLKSLHYSPPPLPPDLLKGWPRFRKTQQALTLSNSENSKMKKNNNYNLKTKEVFIFGPLLNIFQVKIKFKGY